MIQNYPTTFTPLQQQNYSFPKPKSLKRRIAFLSAIIVAAVGIGLAIYFLVFTSKVAEDQSTAIAVSVGSDPVELNSGLLYQIPLSGPGQIYTLYRKSGALFDIPAGRSYDGGIWEPIFPILTLFSCKDQSCFLETAKDGVYVIVPSNASTFTDDEIVADYLIQTTFGPTKTTIEQFPKGENFKARAKSFLMEQMKLEPTLHRAYYRRFANPLMANNTRSGKVRGPCEVGSRWERAALDFYDSYREIKVVNNMLYIDGEFRTKVSPQFLQAGTSPTEKYYLCIMGQTDVGSLQSYSKSAVSETICRESLQFYLPPLDFSGTSPPLSQIVHERADLMSLDVKVDGVFLLKSVSTSCRINSNSRNLYAKDANGVWYRYQPRLRLSTNTVDNPLLRSDFMYTNWDSKVSKDFINEKGCVVIQGPNSEYIERCGSPGEIENDPRKGNQFSFLHNFKFRGDPEYSDLRPINVFEFNSQITKNRVWANIALFSQDQLRQRVAWALSQIFVVSKTSISRISENEFYIKYYDIFVRNAFGNYFDIMKEVSYSPVMGKMLSFIRSKSFQVTRSKPDENYARELMQLFSIGIWKLNRNGTQIRDVNGNPLETYNSFDVQNFARVWTGFSDTPKRGNAEISTMEDMNLLDTMAINVIDHDSFPKHGLDHSYIGDRYPLCKNMPQRAFLRKGSKFQFLDVNYTYYNELKSSNLRLDANSRLYSALCRRKNDGSCELKSSVLISEHLACFGVECEVDTVQTVELVLNNGKSVYYEYIKVPCVDLEFSNEGLTTFNAYKNFAVCVDKNSYRASTLCCAKSGSTISANLLQKYGKEVLSYESAESRCKQQNSKVCGSTFGGIGSDIRVWTDVPCNYGIKIYEDGLVSIYHSFDSSKSPTYAELSPNSNIKFRVDWLNDEYPLASKNCDSLCSIVEGNICKCPLNSTMLPVYVEVSQIPSLKDILNDLKIGAYDPDHFDAGFYSVGYEMEGLVVYLDNTKKLNLNSIFKVQIGASEVIYLANIRATVNIGNNYLFRNIPNFMKFENRYVRDAENEIDAVLKHILYHESTAPFIADLFIKRLVSSNPSPRYIEAVAMKI